MWNVGVVEREWVKTSCDLVHEVVISLPLRTSHGYHGDKAQRFEAVNEMDVKSRNKKAGVHIAIMFTSLASCLYAGVGNR